MNLIFEWDEGKAKDNVRKHQIGFPEAKSIFNDPFLLTFLDKSHSDDEQRFINIGLSVQGRLLIVIHTEREDIVRIISSRKATNVERRYYEERI
jgi:uncharacterized DUF497 family protein